MSFTPRLTKPSQTDPYYSTYDRFYWMDISPYGGNCTGYAYGRFNECAERSLYNDFYITGYNGNTDAQYWIYNTWPDQTHTSGAIDIKLGDILVWGGSSGHVEVVEEINGSALTLSYSSWATTYANSLEFGIRQISMPTWGSTMGTLSKNSGGSATYTNPFIGYIHNKYITPDTPSIITRLIPHFKKRVRLIWARRKYYV